jgi:hypothetical protein
MPGCVVCPVAGWRQGAFSVCRSPPFDACVKAKSQLVRFTPSFLIFRHSHSSTGAGWATSLLALLVLPSLARSALCLVAYTLSIPPGLTLPDEFLIMEATVRRIEKDVRASQDGSFFSWVSDSMVGDEVPPGAPLHHVTLKMKSLKSRQLTTDTPGRFAQSSHAKTA